jgi:hypothetical protein
MPFDQSSPVQPNPEKKNLKKFLKKLKKNAFLFFKKNPPKKIRNYIFCP